MDVLRTTDAADMVEACDQLQGFRLLCERLQEGGVMTRYEISCRECDGSQIATMSHSDVGEYVKYEDVRQKLEMFDEMLDALRCTRKAMQIAGSVHTCNKLDSIITRARALQEAAK